MPPSKPNQRADPSRPETNRNSMNSMSPLSKPKRTQPDRFMVLNAFVDFTLRTLRRNEIAVWLVLYRDTRNGTATVSQKSIADRCGLSDRTVRRCISRLVDAGLLVVVHRGGKMAGASTYRAIPVTRDRLK